MLRCVRSCYGGVLLLLGLVWAAGTAETWAQDTAPPSQPAGRVLFIGIDGCRFDSIEKAATPNLDRLMAEGCYSATTRILGDRYRQSDTVSGPGWSSLLTGVWADKHGVDSNRFWKTRFDRYPHFFARVKEAFPKASTVSIAAWPPIGDKITAAADFNRQPSHEKMYVPGDLEATNVACEVIRGGDPTAMFVYFGQVDEHGHEYGFSPKVKEYVTAIERVDGHVGRIIETLEKRARNAEENWLVIVSTDHGGFGKDHGGGHANSQITDAFLIVSGAKTERGKLDKPTEIVDVVATVLVHLGVAIDPKWELDGRAVGIRTAMGERTAD
jgi:predicted AlkP superfamily pyrophosphatase or phosphodiesterase